MKIPKDKESEVALWFESLITSLIFGIGLLINYVFVLPTFQIKTFLDRFYIVMLGAVWIFFALSVFGLIIGIWIKLEERREKQS